MKSPLKVSVISTTTCETINRILKTLLKKINKSFLLYAVHNAKSLLDYHWNHEIPLPKKMEKKTIISSAFTTSC